MIDERSLSILTTIVYNKERSVDHLKEHFAISNRQLGYSIQKINELILIGTGYEIWLRDDAIIVTEACQQYLERYLLEAESSIYFAKANRQALLYFLLIKGDAYLSLNHFTDLLQTSKSSVLEDLNGLKQVLEARDIQIRYNRVDGYYLTGSERAIRYELLRLVLERLHHDTGQRVLSYFVAQHWADRAEHIRKALTEALSSSPLKVSEYRQEELFYGLTLLGNRLQQVLPGAEESRHLYIDQDSLEYRLANSISEGLEISEPSLVRYLYYWILGIGLGDIHQPSQDKAVMARLLNQLVTRFEAQSGIQFTDRNIVYESLYQHLRPAYYRMKLGFPVINSLTDMVKKEYARLFNLLERVMQSICRDFDLSVEDEEVAYLTIHFATLLMARREPIATRKHAVIICPNGVGTATLLQQELGKMYPDVRFSIANYQDSLDLSNVDVIVSTIVTDVIRKHRKPYLIVNPIIKTGDRDQIRYQLDRLLADEGATTCSIQEVLEIIRQEVTLDQFQRIEQAIYHPERKTYEEEGEDNLDSQVEEVLPLLSDIISEDLVQLDVQAKDWEDAIRQATRVLVEQGKAEQAYIEDMIEITKEIGPYIVITKHVALPHARPESGAKELAICIATLAHPIEFGNPNNDPVKYIFGLSALDSHTHLAAMAELADLLDKSDFYQILSSARQASDIVNYIKQYEERSHSS